MRRPALSTMSPRAAVTLKLYSVVLVARAATSSPWTSCRKISRRVYRAKTTAAAAISSASRRTTILCSSKASPPPSVSIQNAASGPCGPGARVYLRSQKCWDIRQKAPDARRMSAALLGGMQANATQQVGLFGRIEQRWGVFRYTLDHAVVDPERRADPAHRPVEGGGQQRAHQDGEGDVAHIPPQHPAV